jgi:hypothetical protein
MSQCIIVKTAVKTNKSIYMSGHNYLLYYAWLFDNGPAGLKCLETLRSRRVFSQQRYILFGFLNLFLLEIWNSDLNYREDISWNIYVKLAWMGLLDEIYCAYLGFCGLSNSRLKQLHYNPLPNIISFWPQYLLQRMQKILVNNRICANSNTSHLSRISYLHSKIIQEGRAHSSGE